MNGKIILRLKNDKRTGMFEAKIIGHEGDVHCSDDLDESLLKDLLEAEIPGFGDMADVTDSGKTPDHFEEKRKRQNAMGAKPLETAPFDEEEEEKKKKGKELDLGFGV